jgi:hypothetical protein
MSCPACRSSNVAEFTAETIIHFAASKNLDKPGVWLFPQLSICLDCGSSRFTVAESELALLTEGAEAKGALTGSQVPAGPGAPSNCVPPRLSGEG